jgi:hypothetical protein
LLAAGDFQPGDLHQRSLRLQKITHRVIPLGTRTSVVSLSYLRGL